MSSLILNFMNQNDRDFQKVLQALTSFDKKLSNLETVVDKIAKATTITLQANKQLNKEQSSLNKDLGEGLKMLGNSMSDIIQLLQRLGGKN